MSSINKNDNSRSVANSLTRPLTKSLTASPLVKKPGTSGKSRELKNRLQIKKNTKAVSVAKANRFK